MLKKYKFLLSFIGIFLFIYLFYKIDVSIFFLNIKNANHLLLIFSLVPSTIVLFLRGFKWWILTKALNTEISYKKSVVGYLLGASLGAITPARIGNFIRIKFLRENTKKPIQFTVMNIIIDNILDLLIILSMSIISIIFLFYFFGITIVPFFYITFFLLVITLSFITVIKRKFFYSIIKPLLFFLVPTKYKNIFKRNFKIIHNIIIILEKNYILLLLSILVNALSWIFSILACFIIAKAIGINISIIYVLIVISISSLISLLPISISGIGTREATTIFLLSFKGISPELAILFSILVAITTTWFFAVLGAILWIKK